MPQVYELTFTPASSNPLVPSGPDDKHGWIFLPARSDDPAEARFAQFVDNGLTNSNVPATTARQDALTFAQGESFDVIYASVLSWSESYRAYLTWRVWERLNVLYGVGVGWDGPWIVTFKTFADFKAYAAPGQVQITIPDDVSGSLNGSFISFFLGGRTETLQLWVVDVLGDPPPPSDVNSDNYVNGTYYVTYLADSDGPTIAAAIEGKILGLLFGVDLSRSSDVLTIGDPTAFSAATGPEDPSSATFGNLRRWFQFSSTSFSSPTVTDPGWISGPFDDSNIILLTADDETAYTDIPEVEGLDAGVTIAPAGPPPSLPLENLTGYWHWQAGDAGGDVSPDYSGNGRDGTTHGGAYASDGTYGTVWEQDGTSSDYIEVPTTAFASGTQPMTLLALVKPASAAGGYTWAAAFGDSEAFFLGIHGDEAIGGGFTPDFVESSSNPIVADTWHALAIVYDGSALALYVDGTLVASGSASLTHGSATSYIGRQVSFFGEYWNGQIAQVAAFDDVALSAGQVAAWAADPFGTLPTETPIGGTCETETECAGELGLAAALEGACETETECTGELLPTVAIAGLCEAETECTGTLSLSVSLEGLCETETECGGALGLAAALGGVCETETECVGGLLPGLPIAGVCETETECTGEMGTLVSFDLCICLGQVYPTGGEEPDDGFDDGGDLGEVGDGGPLGFVDEDEPLGYVGCCGPEG